MRRDPEKTYEKILEVSSKLFFEKGYENTSLQDIVNNLDGLTKGAVYHHFSSKDDILDAIEDKLLVENNPFKKVLVYSELTGIELIKEASPNLFAKVEHCVLRKCLLVKLYRS